VFPAILIKNSETHKAFGLRKQRTQHHTYSR